MTDSRPKVAVLVLNWNNFPATVDCISSLERQEYSDFETFIIDNGSTDGSAKNILSEFDNKRVILNDENLGFAGGMNTGIRMALNEGFDYILLSNNDIQYESETTLSRLVSILENRPDIGALSPRMGEEQEETNLLQLSQDLRIGRCHPTLDILQSNNLSYNCHYGCVMIPAEVFSEVGLLPEEYFLYYEDLHHGSLIESSGRVLATALTCHVNHRGSDSSEGGYGEIMSYYLTRNRMLFYSSKLPQLVFTIMLVYYLYWVLSRFIYRIYLREWDGARAIIEGAKDGFLLKTGKGPYPQE